jgi:hypothetical protein
LPGVAFYSDTPGAPGLGPIAARVPGSQRCNALGLQLADCQEVRTTDSIYCYYHEKVRSGLLEPTAPVYPVWPLPDVRWQLPTAEISAA